MRVLKREKRGERKKLRKDKEKLREREI